MPPNTDSSAVPDGGDPKRSASGKTLAVLCFATFMASLDLVVVNVAFPAIGKDFPGTSLAALSWVLNGYAIVFAAVLVPAGRLADRYGRRSGLLLGFAIFTVASAACAVSNSIGALIAFRVLQGVGAGVLIPASLGLVVANAPPERRAMAVEIWTATGAIAAALGPTVGGLLVEGSWRWIFLANIPLGLIAILATIRLVSNSKDTKVTGMPDFVGAALLAIGVGLLALGLVMARAWGFAAGRTDLTWVVAVAALLAFVAQSKRHPAPVIAPELVRVPSFKWANLALLLFAIPFAASLLGAVLWLQQVWGYSPLKTGLAITPAPLIVPPLAGVGHKLSTKMPVGVVVAIGCLLLAIGSVVIAASVGPQAAYAAEFLPGWLIGGAGIGLALPAVVSAATADLPAGKEATGGGVVSANRQIGAALGVSILVAVLGTPGTGAATHAAFQHMWWVLAAVSVLAAIPAIRLTAKVTEAPAQGAAA